MFNIFKKKTTESYFSQPQYDIDETDRMHEILSYSRISKSSAENSEFAMKLIYENGVAIKLYEIEEGEYCEEFKVRFSDKPISYKDYRINDLRRIITNENGNHYFGGIFPDDFVKPDNPTLGPLIYLGQLKCSIDKYFEWTNIPNIHLVCPIHADFDIIYLDYSTPNKPKLIDVKQPQPISTAYDDLKPTDIIEFEKTPISFEKPKLELVEEESYLGSSGAPRWVQNEEIPKCPKSGKSMKFLLSIDTNEQVALKYSNVEIKDESMRNYIESFNFWCDGELFIFIEPETKTIAYFIQNT